MATEQFQRFLETSIADEELRRCVPILMESLPRNARKCERFVETLSFTLSSRKETRKPIVTSLLVKLMTLQDLHPALNELLRQYPKLLEFAELHYAGTPHVDASVRTLLDEVATVTPAFKRILEIRIDGADTFEGVDIGPYIYVLDPVMPAMSAMPAAEPAGHTDSTEAKVAKGRLRQYADIFVRRHERTTLPFGAGAAFSVSEIVTVPPLYGAGSETPEGRSFAQIVAANGHVVLLGDPGSGKSTLLRQLGIEIARNDERLPALIRFRELHRLRDGTATELLTALELHFRDSEIALGAAALRGLVESGRLLLLLDGLDEIPEEMRPRVREALLALTSRYPRTNIVITSRIASYHPIGGPFREYTVGRLNDAAWQQMATTLLAAAGIKNADQFFEEVERLPSIRELARNPLLLAMLVSVYQATHTLSRSRIHLIRRAVDVMVERWDSLRGIELPLRGQKVHALMGMLAEEMLRSESPTLTSQQVAAVIRRFRSLTQAVVDPEAVIDTLVARTGLLEELSPGVYQFVHQFLFEFFAAEAIVRSSQGLQAIPKLAERGSYGVIRDALLLTTSDEAAFEVADRLADGSPAAIEAAVDVALDRFKPPQKELLRTRILTRARELEGSDQQAALISAQRLGRA